MQLLLQPLRVTSYAVYMYKNHITKHIEIRIHNNYDILQHEMFTNTSATVWDVALLRLPHAVTLIARRVEMISMATFLQDFRGSDHCWIGGWGRTTPDRKFLGHIKVVLYLNTTNF